MRIRYLLRKLEKRKLKEYKSEEKIKKKRKEKEKQSKKELKKDKETRRTESNKRRERRERREKRRRGMSKRSSRGPQRLRRWLRCVSGLSVMCIVLLLFQAVLGLDIQTPRRHDPSRSAAIHTQLVICPERM